jgi:hypothetical protein
MFPTHTTFIGIDPTAGRKPFVYAALDHEKHLLALGQGGIDEILAFVAGQHHAYVAVCAPSQPNRGLMERDDIRLSLNPPPRPGRWGSFRLVEYQLRQHNIFCPQTPARPEDCPNWMRIGFSLYRRLEALGYCAYPAKESPLVWLEVYPHACFCTLLGITPFSKYTLEGRIQRQLVLLEQELHIPDPMRLFEEITRHRLLQGVLPLEDLYQPGELDALAGAYTAWVAATRPDKILTLGHPEEGQMILPVPELKRRY